MLNAIRTNVPESGSTEDTMLQQCELKVSRDDPLILDKQCMFMLTMTM